MAAYPNDHDEKQTPPMLAGEVKQFKGKSGQQEEENPPQM